MFEPPEVLEAWDTVNVVNRELSAKPAHEAAASAQINLGIGTPPHSRSFASSPPDLESEKSVSCSQQAADEGPIRAVDEVDLGDEVVMAAHSLAKGVGFDKVAIEKSSERLHIAELLSDEGVPTLRLSAIEEDSPGGKSASVPIHNAVVEARQKSVATKPELEANANEPPHQGSIPLGRRRNSLVDELISDRSLSRLTPRSQHGLSFPRNLSISKASSSLARRRGSHRPGISVLKRVFKRKLSEMPAKIDPERLGVEVAQATVRSAFLATKVDINAVVERAHRLARLDGAGNGQSSLAMRMEHFMRQEIGGLAVQNIVLCALDFLVPFGSMVLSVIVIYGASDFSSFHLAALFTLHSLCLGLGAMIWMHVARRCPIPRAFGISGFCQLFTLPLLYAPSTMGIPGTYIFTMLQALAAGAAVPLYHGFNYSNKWGGDTGTALGRMALVEPMRFLLLFVLIAVMVQLEPGGKPPVSVEIAFGTQAALITILASLSFYIPIDEKLRLPHVPVTWSALKISPAYMFVTVGECVSKLGAFLEVLLVNWLLVAQFSKFTIASLFFTIAATGFVVALAFCVMVIRAHATSRPLLVYTGLATFPPSLLGALAMASSPSLGPEWTLTFLVLSIILAALKRMSTSALKVFSLPSRWKYIVFQSHAALVQQVIEASSPGIVLGLWTALGYNTSLTDTYSDVLAQQILTLAIPFTSVAYLVHLAAIRPVFHEQVAKWFPPPANMEDDQTEPISDECETNATTSSTKRKTVRRERLSLAYIDRYLPRIALSRFSYYGESCTLRPTAQSEQSTHGSTARSQKGSTSGARTRSAISAHSCSSTA